MSIPLRNVYVADLSLLSHEFFNVFSLIFGKIVNLYCGIMPQIEKLHNAKLRNHLKYSLTCISFVSLQIQNNLLFLTRAAMEVMAVVD